MKATFLTIATTLLLSANIFAAEPMKYTNEIVTDFGKQLEQTIFKNDYPSKRIVDSYDYQGNLMERITYNWTVFEGWVPVTKFEYSYNPLNEIAVIAHLSWSRNKKEWNNKQEEIALYNTKSNNSIFLVEKK